MYDYGRMALYVKNMGKKMKIKELFESLKGIRNSIKIIIINGFRYEGFDDYKKCCLLDLGGDDLDVDTWGFGIEKDSLNQALVIRTKSAEVTDSEDSEDSKELTVSDVLENINFDDENTIIVYGKTGQTLYDSDEDGVFALCELLCLDVKEYIQIHRGKHQIIEIHLRSY